MSTFAHLDLDAFFASVEVLDNPELKGKPVVVGGNGRRGVVASCTYEARQFGIRSAMSSVEAQRRCPRAIFVHGHYSRYTEKSREVFDVISDFTPFIEQLGLDECFLDISGTQSLFGSPREFCAALRDAIRDRTGLMCSIGVSDVKFIAKIASEAAKPIADSSGIQPGAGVLVIEPGKEQEFLFPLPIGAVWGIGPATKEKLDRFGVRTVKELAALPKDALVSALGPAWGEHLYDLSHCRDAREIHLERGRKSIGREETFSHDIYDRHELETELMQLAEDVEATLYKSDMAASTVSLKLKRPDFKVFTRSVTPVRPVSTAREIHREAIQLLDALDLSQGARLIGVSVSGLSDRSNRQLALGADDDWITARDAVLAVKTKFGRKAIKSARLLDSETRRDHQWGPPPQK